MKKIIETINCDRCGREITGEPVRIVPHHVPRNSWPGVDEQPGVERNGLPAYIDRMMGKDFCEDCSAEIVDFALNGNACDECVDGILDSVNGRDEDGPDNPEAMPDPEGVDWDAALDRIELANQPDESAETVSGTQETVPEQPEGGEGAENDAVQEAKKQTGRKKLDHGKIMALHRAGWSNAHIADEMGTSKGTIASTISLLKKGQQGDA